MWPKGKRQTPAHRAKISASRKGQRHSPEVCAKIGASQRGKKRARTDAWNERISRGMLAFWQKKKGTN